MQTVAPEYGPDERGVPVLLAQTAALGQFTTGKEGTIAEERQFTTVSNRGGHGDGARPNHGREMITMSFVKEFRDFVGSGNVIDLAVGVIVGSAMSSILKSFVDELIVPLTGLIGKVDLSNQYLVLKGTVPDGAPLAKARTIDGAVVLGVGQFLTIAINTLILALAVFLVVRAVNHMRSRIADSPAPSEPPAPPADVALLSEIRDLLKSQQATPR